MVEYRLFKHSKDGTNNNDETTFNVVSNHILESLRIGDSIGLELEDAYASIVFYKVISRTFYEDDKGAICDIVVEEECD